MDECTFASNGMQTPYESDSDKYDRNTKEHKLSICALFECNFRKHEYLTNTN